ncbi:hypothetical protein NQ317_006799 [Molorchus minor]|uniref:Uncharacterized protein n=1 Tax=Molorchus minor TaxID=1323400 RepID=A0ABQ9IWY2_9CUCU|nr:hypothetical protein NQ317_006799 [Molorchus minor]
MRGYIILFLSFCSVFAQENILCTESLLPAMSCLQNVKYRMPHITGYFYLLPTSVTVVTTMKETNVVLETLQHPVTPASVVPSYIVNFKKVVILMATAEEMRVPSMQR